MRFLSLTILTVLLFLSPLAAVDLFGSAASGKPTKAEQKQQYLDLFADEDSQANTSKRRWALAIKLEGLLENSDVSNIHPYMARRILELLKRERSAESYQLQLKAFDVLYPGPNYDAKQVEQLRDLLEKLYKKESGRAQNKIAQRMIQLLRKELLGAIDVNDIETARDVSDDLSDWYKDVLDRKGQREMELVEEALKERYKFDKKLRGITASAEQGSADAVKDLALYSFECNDFETIRAMLENEQQAKPLSSYKNMFLVADKLYMGSEISVEEAAQVILDIASTVKSQDRLLLETKLLNIGTVLRQIMDAARDADLEKTLKFKAQQASAPWELRLRDRGIFREQFDHPQLGSQVTSIGRDGGAVKADVQLDEHATVMLYMMGNLAYGKLDKQLQQKVDQLDLANKPQFKLINASQPKLWSGAGELPPEDVGQKHKVVMAMVGGKMGINLRVNLDRVCASIDVYCRLLKEKADHAVIISPLLQSEDDGRIKIGGERYQRLEKIAAFMEASAKKHGIGYINVFQRCVDLYKKDDSLMFFQCFAGSYKYTVPKISFDLVRDSICAHLGLIDEEDLLQSRR